LHAFGASNVLDAAALVAHVTATVRAARRLAQATGTIVRLVDAGGGLGIPYEAHEESLDLVRLGAGLATIVDGWATDPLLADARLLLEPGRFLVGAAGAYMARVVDRKTVDGATVVILDGGVHHVLRPALVGQEHRIRPLGGGGATPRGPERTATAGGADGSASLAERGATPAASNRLVPVTVAGPLCSGLDVFSQAAVMVPPDVGELVAILDVGAYGFTESMPLFLSHPIPAEVAVRGGVAHVIRPRQDPAEWLDRQSVPDWPT
jgi:diaminopimelate decarboxylase